MATTVSYSKIVAARTRTGKALLGTPDLLELFLGEGGLSSDLDDIVVNGLRAEAANQGQSAAGAGSAGTTVIVLQTFTDVRAEYQRIMAVAQAVLGDLRRRGAAKELIVAVERILLNEQPIQFATPAAGAKKKATKVDTQEALRTEIQKDVAAIIALEDAAPLFAARRVTKDRLLALQTDVTGLAGKLGERTIAKGARKEATKAEHAAVAAQSAAWAACYRILAAVGAKNASVQALLSEAVGRK